MAMRLVDGDYLSDGLGGFETVAGRYAAAQRAVFRLRARRGGFPLAPEVGSRLHLLPREKPSARQRAAEQYINEALAGEPGTELTAVTVEERDGELMIKAVLDISGEEVSLSMTV